MSDGNVLLGDDEIDKLVVSRMNREFMKFERHYYAHRLNEPFGMFGTVLTIESNVEMGVVDLDSLKLGVTVVRGGRGGVLVYHYFHPMHTHVNGPQAIPDVHLVACLLRPCQGLVCPPATP